MVQQRVTIIGAGIVGASIAYRLAAEESLDVRIVDGSSPGSGTTSASMAWLNASNKRPEDYFRLNHAGVREYEALRKELPAEWLHQVGSLAADSFTPSLADRIAELRKWGYGVESLTARDAYGRFAPGATVTDPEELVAHYAEEGWIETTKAISALLLNAAQHGAVFQQGCTVIRIDELNPGFLLTLSDGTTFKSDIVVNAAGPRGDRVASLLGRHLPLAPTKGITLRLYAPELELKKVLLTGLAEVRPDADGYVRVHDDAVDGTMAQGAATDRNEIIQELQANAGRLFPVLAKAPIASVFMANRPIPADSYSCIGPVQEMDGYFEAITHSGVTLGPLIGRLIREFIVDGTKNELLTSRFSPDRFSDF